MLTSLTALLQRLRAIAAGLAVCASLLLAACGVDDPQSRFDAHLEQARAFVAADKLDAAVIEFKNAIVLRPRDAELRFELGRLYLENGEPASAIKELEKAQASGLSSPELMTALMAASAQRGDYERALTSIAGMDETSRASSTVLAVQGDAELTAGKADAARQRYQAALEQDGEEIDALLGLARISLGNDDVDEAARQIGRALEVDAGNSTALALQAAVAARRNEYDEAVASLELALQNDPGNLNARVQQVSLFIAMGRYDSAAESLDALEQLAQSSPQTLFLRGQVALGRNQLDEARSAFTEVLLAIPAHPASQLFLSQILARQGDLGGAEKHALGFLEAVPGNPTGLQLLGAIYLQRGRADDAVAILEQLVPERAEDATFLTLMATAMKATGRNEEGDDYLSRAQALAPGSSAVELRAAMAELIGGNPDRAIARLREATAAGDFSGADHLLVQLLTQRGEFDEAMRVVDALLARSPEDVVAYDLKGAIYLARGDTKTGRRYFEQALAIDPASVPTLILLSGLDLDTGDPAAAHDKLDRALAADDSNADVYLARARLAEFEGDADAAIASLEQAREKVPTAVAPRLALAEFHRRAGNGERALTLVREAEALAPASPQVLFALGRAQLTAGLNQDAMETFERLEQRFAESVELKLQLIATAGALGDRERVARYLDAVLQLDPGNLQALMVSAKLAAADGDYARATETVERARAAAPDDPRAAILAGDILLAEGRDTAALAIYEQVARDTPLSELTLRLLDFHYGRDNAEKARDIAERWLAEHPGDVKVRNAVAALALESGENAAAAARYETVLADDPDNVIALNNLAFLYQESAPTRALEYAERAMKLAPEVFQVLDTYGWLLVGQGQVERGLGLLEKARRLAPDNLEVRFHYAAALHKAGDTAAARDLLDSLLADKSAFPQREEARELRASLD